MSKRSLLAGSMQQYLVIQQNEFSIIIKLIVEGPMAIPATNGQAEDVPLHVVLVKFVSGECFKIN